MGITILAKGCITASVHRGSVLHNCFKSKSKHSKQKSFQNAIVKALEQPGIIYEVNKGKSEEFQPHHH